MLETIRLAIAGIIKEHKAPLLAKKLGDLSESTLYKWMEASTEDSKHGDIPLRRAIQLTLITGDSRLMAAIAEEAGGVYLPGLALVEGRFESEKAACRVMKASAELIETWICAKEDGKISAAEYKELANEVKDLQLAAAAILASAREKAGI